jgi:hypothetical protein
MTVGALTFRAEPDFIEAIRAYAKKMGISVNSALKGIIAPVIGVSHSRTATAARNDLAKFCGVLKDVDCTELEAAQTAFSVIDEEMWK